MTKWHPDKCQDKKEICEEKAKKMTEGILIPVSGYKKN